MKNADKPAMPVETGKLYEMTTSDADGYSAAAAGLTKREHFAALAMQGLIARGEMIDDNLAREAWGAADSMMYVQGETQ